MILENCVLKLYLLAGILEYAFSRLGMRLIGGIWKYVFY